MKIGYMKRSIFSMCNMRSKPITTDHIYIHKYRNYLFVVTFLNRDMYLKSLLFVWATQDFEWHAQKKTLICLNVRQVCINYYELMADSTFL